MSKHPILVVSASGEGNGDSPADAFIRTVIDGAAQYEHGLIRARTCAALGPSAPMVNGSGQCRSAARSTPTACGSSSMSKSRRAYPRMERPRDRQAPAR